MKRSFEEASGSAWRRRDTGPKMKYCLKALIPDVFASSLLRDKGTLKDQLQEESGTRLVFSNKGDFFPDTQLRVLGVYSDVLEGITRVLELILGRMKELAEDDRGRHPPVGCEMLGPEGELILRLILSREMTGLLIGSQGSKIKELRQSSGCKIHIRDEATAGHRLATFSGSLEVLLTALEQVAENMRQEADAESEEFQSYQRSINFGEAHEGLGGAWGYGYEAPKGGKGYFEGKGSNVLRQLWQEMDSLPRGAAELTYSIKCALPATLVPALIGRSGDYIRSIEEKTGAKVNIPKDNHLEGYRMMECVGPLVSIYSAHSLMMHRLQEVESPARRPQEWRPRPEAPKTQLEKQQELLSTIAELEEKLAVAKNDF